MTNHTLGVNRWLGSLRAGLGATDDGHRVTPIELLFDLVFVYAITNITASMEHHVGGTAVLEGVITLLVVWFGWCSYTWLGNQARADRGLVRVAMVVAMGGMFFVAISIPNVFEGHGNAALVLVVGYAVVRLTHLVVYLVAADGDRGLRRVLARMLVVCGVMLALLSIGVAVGGPAQKWWWLAAVLADQIGVFVAGASGWHVNSAPHFAERFGLIVIIAIGESIVAVGRATATPELSARDIAALVCGLAIAVALWWLYFGVVAERTQQALHEAGPDHRVRLGRDSYTYLHLPLVGGVVFTALGLAFLVAGTEHIDAGRYALYGGIAVYLAALVAFRVRSTGSFDRFGLATAATLAIAIVPLTALPSLAQLAVPAAVLVGLLLLESRPTTLTRPASTPPR